MLWTIGIEMTVVLVDGSILDAAGKMIGLDTLGFTAANRSTEEHETAQRSNAQRTSTAAAMNNCDKGNLATEQSRSATGAEPAEPEEPGEPEKPQRVSPCRLSST